MFAAGGIAVAAWGMLAAFPGEGGRGSLPLPSPMPGAGMGKGSAGLHGFCVSRSCRPCSSPISGRTRGGWSGRGFISLFILVRYTQRGLLAGGMKFTSFALIVFAIAVLSNEVLLAIQVAAYWLPGIEILPSLLWSAGPVFLRGLFYWSLHGLGRRGVPDGGIHTGTELFPAVISLISRRHFSA
ncbi:MAG: hypothetical protein P4L51_26805 [Puia sp.]|nr:hypothetical protein [Puia sp.]